jgi:hypothetical protein
MELTPRSAKRLTDAPNIAHGLPFVGELGGRDSHSSAFFSTPGTELYSGTAKIRTARLTGAVGKNENTAPAI